MVEPGAAVLGRHERAEEALVAEPADDRVGELVALVPGGDLLAELRRGELAGDGADPGLVRGGVEVHRRSPFTTFPFGFRGSVSSTATSRGTLNFASRSRTQARISSASTRAPGRATTQALTASP